MTSCSTIDRILKTGLTVVAGFVLLYPAHGQNPGSLLWQIGTQDGDDREFALAPNGHANYRDDGFFVVGRSDAKRDWPYVQPGPVDGWGGGRPHTFTVTFGLKEPPNAGECKLRVALVDTHSRANPELKISLNNEVRKHQTPPGAGDASIFGETAKGKPHNFEISFPATVLKSGLNELAITTSSGSWIIYDWVGFEAPAGTELADVTGTSIASASSPPVLVRRGSQFGQIVQFTVRHFGENREAELRVDGEAVTNITLRGVTQKCEIAVPAVEPERTVSIELNVSGKPAARQAVTLKPVRKWTVYLLPHSHVDIGYTHVQTDVEQAQWRYIGMGIEAARKSAAFPQGSRFKWNTEVLWAVDSYLKQATPEKKKEFLDAVKAGWVGLDALYGNELTGLCRPEELIRLVSFAARLASQTGVPIESAMITDVPGYTWGIVPAFAQAGVKYFSMGPNGGDRIGHTIAAWGDKPFWWIGPNGRDRVLVWMTGTGYYRVFQSPEMLHNYLSSLEAKGYPYDMVQVRHCLGDNGAPDVDFADTVNKWNATYAYPKLIIATTAEMFHDFEKRYGDKLPTARGDFTPYWEDGAASSARETALNRVSADRLSQAETLFA
ncbi:MAG TPA: polysaccharide lyase family protein, partial [Verrucomicrobiae bacterium]